MRLLISLIPLLALVGCSDTNNSAGDTSSGMPSDDPNSNSITSNSYVNVLENSLELMRGQYYQRLLGVINSGNDVWGAALSQPSGELQTGSCPEGGTFSKQETYTQNDAGQVSENTVLLTLNQCRLNGVLIHGNLDMDFATESSRQGTTLTQNIALSDLSITWPDYNELMTAELSQTAGVFGFQQYYDVDFQTSNYVRTSGENQLELSSASYTQSYNHEQDTQGSTTAHRFAESGGGVLQLSGNLNLRGTITLFPAFEYANQSSEDTQNWMHTSNLASGNLEVASIDGSRIQVSPDTGNIDTVNYIISSDGFQTLVEDFWFAPAGSSQLP